MRCFYTFWWLPPVSSGTPHPVPRPTAVYIARYDRVTPSRHLNVLHQDGLAATYTYAVNRQECF